MAKTDNIAIEIGNLLEEYDLKGMRAVEAAAKEAAEVTARELQRTSPKRKSGKGKGRYAKGWRVKRMAAGTLVSYVVYNGSNPGLTHVLEHGHVSRNQYGSWGRVRAIPHIGPAAEAGIQRFELGIRARLRKG